MVSICCTEPHTVADSAGSLAGCKLPRQELGRTCAALCDGAYADMSNDSKQTPHLHLHSVSICQYYTCLTSTPGLPYIQTPAKVPYTTATSVMIKLSMRHIRLTKNASVLHMLAHLAAANSDLLLQYPQGMICFTTDVTLVNLPLHANRVCLTYQRHEAVATSGLGALRSDSAGSAMCKRPQG